MVSIKEVEKFFKRATNSLVSAAKFGEIKDWQQAIDALEKIEGFLSIIQPIIPTFAESTRPKLNVELPFNPKNLQEELEHIRNSIIKQLAKDNYVNKLGEHKKSSGDIRQKADKLETNVDAQTNRQLVELDNRTASSSESSSENRQAKAKQELPSTSLNSSQTPNELSKDTTFESSSQPISLAAGSQVIDKKEQKKLHRRYENWYSRVPAEKLAENGGIIPSLNTAEQKAELLYYQVDAAVSHFEGFVGKCHRAELLRAGVGVGKTYIFGQILRWLWDIKFHEGPVHSLFPYIVVTKASIVTQTERVLRDKFGLPISNFGGGIMVTNYDQLRASLGNIMIQWHTQVVEGEEVLFPVWREVIHPCFIVWDECQSLKNEGSVQTKVARAFSRIPDRKINETELGKHPSWKEEHCVKLHGEGNVQWAAPNTWQLFSSATPFTTVSEAKTFALATRARVGKQDMEGYKGE